MKHIKKINEINNYEDKKDIQDIQDILRIYFGKLSEPDSWTLYTYYIRNTNNWKITYRKDFSTDINIFLIELGELDYKLNNLKVENKKITQNDKELNTFNISFQTTEKTIEIIKKESTIKDFNL